VLTEGDVYRFYNATAAVDAESGGERSATVGASCFILKSPKGIKLLACSSLTATFTLGSGKLTWFCAGVASRRQNQSFESQAPD
jgi:hypothetical protein